MTKKTYLKTVLAVGFALFSITSAILVADRLSTEAMAVLAGAMCGVGAAIPTSLLLLLLLLIIIIVAVTRRTHQAETTPEPPPRFTQPVVFTVPPMQIQPPTPAPPPATWETVPRRRFYGRGGPVCAGRDGGGRVSQYTRAAAEIRCC